MAGGLYGTGGSDVALSREGRAHTSGRPRPLRPSQGCSGDDGDAPVVRVSTSQRRIKGEDVVFMREGASRSVGAPTWSLYCICDGHRGAGAAKYVKRHLWSALAPLLPRTRPELCESEDFREFALKVSTAVVEALVEVGEQFSLSSAVNSAGSSGTTVTLALLCGRLLTVANLGDSDAVLDTGSQTVLATVSHRLETNDAERKRLADAGMLLASQTSIINTQASLTNTAQTSVTQASEPWEPVSDTLRCWPGGLAFSRSIGDIEAGKHIISLPHIFQAVLPLRRTRLLMGSDGLWDMIQWQKASRMIHDAPIAAAASRVVSGALSIWGGPCQDDTTAVVLDILPAKGAPVGVAGPAVDRAAAFRKERKFGGLLSSCLCGTTEIVDASNRNANPDNNLRILARIDGIDLIKSSANGLGCRISMASARAREKAEEITRRSDPVHWAPAAAFLTAQRAQLGARSLGPTPSQAAAKRAAANGLRGPRKGALASRTNTNLSGLFY